MCCDNGFLKNVICFLHNKSKKIGNCGHVIIIYDLIRLGTKRIAKNNKITYKTNVSINIINTLRNELQISLKHFMKLIKCVFQTLCYNECLQDMSIMYTCDILVEFNEPKTCRTFNMCEK